MQHHLGHPEAPLARVSQRVNEPQSRLAINANCLSGAPGFYYKTNAFHRPSPIA